MLKEQKKEANGLVQSSATKRLVGTRRLISWEERKAGRT